MIAAVDLRVAVLARAPDHTRTLSSPLQRAGGRLSIAVERAVMTHPPVVALLTAGVEMDVLGLAYTDFSAAQREAVVQAHPRTPHFKDDIIQSFYDGIKHKPATTFGNVKADVLADKDPSFHRMNFCSVIRGSQWKG